MRKTIIWILLVTFSTASSLHAEDAVVLNRDDKAPFRGVLLSPDKAQELKDSVIELEGTKKLNVSLGVSLNLQQDIINRKDQQLKLMLESEDMLSKRLGEERSISDFTKVLCFAAGVLATILVLYGVKASH